MTERLVCVTNTQYGARQRYLLGRPAWRPSCGGGTPLQDSASRPERAWPPGLEGKFRVSGAIFFTEALPRKSSETKTRKEPKTVIKKTNRERKTKKKSKTDTRKTPKYFRKKWKNRSETTGFQNALDPKAPTKDAHHRQQT